MTATRIGVMVAGLGIAGFVVVGCGGGGSAGPVAKPDTNSTLTPPTTSADAASATFDGDFSGRLSLNLCNTATQGSVKASVQGDATPTYLGSVDKTELNFMGPGGGIYSTKPGTTISVSNGTFDVDGLTLSDKTITHKSVTVHGTLTCP